MRTNILIVTSVIVISVLGDDIQEKRTNYLGNFHATHEEHEKNIEQSRLTPSIHKIRHKSDKSRKINKARRCRRYAQIYYQNYVPANCYYTVCRQNYCGYCPTSSCRRRCLYGCTTQVATTPISTTSWKPNITECNCDKHGSKIQACDQNTGKCICKPHYEGTKCDQCEADYWKFESICKPCDCNYNGSVSSNCDVQTGLCPCKAGVQGRRCDSCQDKHYGNVTVGCKACDPCEEEGHICHPENGKCVCPKLTRGRKCEQCVPNAWGYEPGIGCKPCECSITGSSNRQCDFVSGRCTCKPGFEGEKCDKCSFGYYHHPNCQKCNCTIAGTRAEDCIHGTCTCSENGCRCKENVEGQHCDRCKKGTFGMDAEHPEGCIDCFCSNRSRMCTASTYMWHQVRTSDVRKLNTVDCINQRFCWHLPSKFTGDLIQSYGGYLRITSNSPKNSVILIGNGITIESITDPRGDIKITETFWKVRNSPEYKLPHECVYNLLTRSCFMVVLQNITRIVVESSLTSQNLRLDEVVLDKASHTYGIPQAKSVEQCICPKNYASASCQDPNIGYFRYYPKPEQTSYDYIDRNLGIAKLCQCNNKSNICDGQSGHCFNCKYFTTGPNCELCAEGYYRDSRGNCVPCVCPSESQNFAKNCTVTGTEFTCACREGYSGKKCDQCGDHYWGNPQELGGLCQQCNCNPHGSEILRCDKLTGQCKCKPGFISAKCSKCSTPRYVIQDGTCMPCDECTQILFHTLDDFSLGVNSTLDLFKDGLGPPWVLLNSTLYRYEFLTDKFDNLEIANKTIQNANVPLLEKKIEKIKRNIQDRNNKINLQTKSVNDFRHHFINTSKTIMELEHKINSFIENINNFGKSHVNVNEALREAEELLKDIDHIFKEAPTTYYYGDLLNKCHILYREVNDTYRNDSSATMIKQELDNLRSRLIKFKKVLNRTDDINKYTQNKNNQNKRRIEALKRSINEIHQENTIFNKNISELMRKINVTNDLLQYMRTLYETLSVLNLKDSIESLDKEEFSQIFNTLPEVRKHVNDLQNKINSYQNSFNFTSEDWKKIDASGAYEKILKGIQHVNREVGQARNITLDALKKLYPSNDDSLSDKTNLATAFSDRILKRIMNLYNLTGDFRKVSEDLDDLKHAILFNGKSNNELNSFLRQIHKNITEQFRNLSELEKVKSNARNASSLAADIEQEIKNINITVQYELTKMYEQYLQLLSKKEVADLKEKLNKTRINIANIDLTIFEKITDATKNKFNATKRNIASMQKHIQELKENIQSANERVESVDFGVNIANCERSYKLKSDILRSLEIDFKCKKCILLKLYNYKNETISIFYESNMAYITWRNQTESISTDKKISLERRGSKIEIKNENQTRKYITDNELFTTDKLQIGDVNNKSLDACIRKLKLNGQTVGLWKFTNSKGICPGCFRNTSTDGLPYEFFSGNGYRKISRDLKEEKGLKPSELTFVFNFATFDENSLIFLSQDTTNASSYISFRLNDGHLQLNVNHINGQQITIISAKKYNSGNETSAEISLFYKDDHQTYSLKVAGENKTEQRRLSRINVYKIRKSEIFIGGVSSVFNEKSIPDKIIPFMGNLRVKGSLIVTNENSLSYNVEPGLRKLEFYKAWFSGSGFVNLEFTKNVFNADSEITFLIKPVKVDDNYVMNINDKLDIHFSNSSLIFHLDGTVKLSFASVCVNSTNLISIRRNIIQVNEERKNITEPTDVLHKVMRFYMGNYKNSRRALFFGTISDIFLDNTPLLFSSTSVKSFLNVEIGRDKLITSKSEFCIKEMQSTERYIKPNYKTEPQAFKFGDKSNSFVVVKNFTVGKKFMLEFQFRTFYPNGLLFYANSYSNNRSAIFYTVLEIQGGDIRLRVQGHKTKTMNLKRKINDGTWHHIQIEQIIAKKKWRFVVKLDKKWKIKERSIRNNFNGALYIGGLSNTFPVHRKLKNELHPFRGCIRSLKFNRNPQIVKNNHIFYNDVGKCFQNVEEGAYFAGDAFAVYKRNFKVNNFLELSFEFKTAENNGVLLSVSNFENSPALSVELQNGAVVMTIDMGRSIISQVTNSPHSDSTLADNKWHNITALYSSSELTVNVDGIRKSWVQSDINSMMDAIEAPLYIGGLPTNAPSGTLKIKENFRGCIRKFKIEDNIMDWTDMKELNNVQLNLCLA